MQPELKNLVKQQPLLRRFAATGQAHSVEGLLQRKESVAHVYLTAEGIVAATDRSLIVRDSKEHVKIVPYQWITSYTYTHGRHVFEGTGTEITVTTAVTPEGKANVSATEELVAFVRRRANL